MSYNETRRKHILLISGDPLTSAEVKMELVNHYDVSISSTVESAVDALEMYDTSAVVVCIRESHEEAFSVFTGALESIKSKSIPIIFLAEKGCDIDEEAAFKLGAVDYSARRHGTPQALVSRINHRILAGEHARWLESGIEDAPTLSTAPEAILENKTIIIVDDLSMNREIVEAMLSNIKGLKMEFATNGKEAVDIFAADSGLYALILMDVQMPVMDGLTATKTIRSLDCFHSREIPIIAMTAGVSPEEISLCMDAGMNGYVEKPLAYDELLTVAANHVIQIGGEKH